MCLPALLRRLDICQQSFRKTEPALNLPLKASDYLRRQVKFTPFPNEPVGWIIENSGPEMLLFSTDYPHPEGTKDPIGRFEGTMGQVSEQAKERFYSGNFAEMMGTRLTGENPQSWSSEGRDAPAFGFEFARCACAGAGGRVLRARPFFGGSCCPTQRVADLGR